MTNHYSRYVPMIIALQSAGVLDLIRNPHPTLQQVLHGWEQHQWLADATSKCSTERFKELSGNYEGMTVKVEGHDVPVTRSMEAMELCRYLSKYFGRGINRIDALTPEGGSIEVCGPGNYDGYYRRTDHGVMLIASFQPTGDVIPSTSNEFIECDKCGKINFPGRRYLVHNQDFCESCIDPAQRHSTPSVFMESWRYDRIQQKLLHHDSIEDPDVYVVRK